MCAGIRDAANLSWKLAAVVKGHASQELLDTYQSERAPHAREFIRIASRLGTLVHVTDPVAAAARDLQLKTNPGVMNTPQPRLGPGIDSDGSPLAGTRAVQPRLNDGRLLDDTVGSTFVVLCSTEIAAELRSIVGRRTISVVDASHSEVRDYLQAVGVIAILIRPDRYIVGVANTLNEMRQMIVRLPLLH